MFLRLAGGLVVRSRWRPYRPAPGERVLVLRAGGAFPPGHPTTRLCLELLAEALPQRPVQRLADVGCGSGVLGLAAALLGVPVVAAVDLSRRAALTTLQNSRRAGCPRSMFVSQGSSECLRGPFDLVVANLPAAVQADKTEEFHRLAGPRGALILSGFRDTQEEGLRAAYRALGWECAVRRLRDAWAPELPPELSYTWAAWRLERRRESG
ncbi:MAG: methyltransferase [Deltaproteobacteria bacterium]|nr:methyltransferase [Deltaproteobacteria bacterium]